MLCNHEFNLDRSMNMKVIALDPGTNNVTVKVGDEYNWNIPYIFTNGLEVVFTILIQKD